MSNNTHRQNNYMENETVQSSESQPRGKNKFISVALIVVILAVLGGITYAMLRKHTESAGAGYETVTRVSKEEIELLLKDINPMMLAQLSQNPEAKKELAANLAELFALANQAKKEGLADQEPVRRELENIRAEVLAVNYAQTVNKDNKEGVPDPFSFITEEQVSQFWQGSDDKKGFLEKIGLGAGSGTREQAFEKFLNAKIEMARESGAMPKDREISEEEKNQAKEYFAKTRVAAAQAEEKRAELGEDFWRRIELQTKLQQAQFLARTYAQKNLEKRTEVTDADVEKYLAEHPEMNNSAEKKTKAEDILRRAKEGEDFGKLAAEFSEDPGSKDKGGLYEGITEGSFVPEFEQTVWSLEPGQVAPALVETKFGYHIIKLEKKGETKGPDGQMKRSFDARHILIATGIKDPENPMAQPVSPKEFAKQKLAKEKEEKVMAEIKANNPVEVAQDFTIPQVSPEQMQQMMQQQMPMNPQELEPEPEAEPKAEPKADKKSAKPAPKKN